MSKSATKNIFIALPMSSIPEAEYLEIREKMLALVAILKGTNRHRTIYFAGDILGNNLAFNSPEESAKIDLAGIEACDVFVFIYPKKTPTSAIFEAGYAIGRQKKSIYLHRKGVELPFLLNGFPQVHYETFDDWVDLTVKLLPMLG